MTLFEYLVLIISGTKYKPTFEETSYKVVMRLVIKNVTIKDYGTYKCISKNSLGDTEGSMKLYRKYSSPLLLPVFLKVLFYNFSLFFHFFSAIPRTAVIIGNSTNPGKLFSFDPAKTESLELY